MDDNLAKNFQCLKNVQLPTWPFLVGVVIQRTEAAWAKSFPLRLLLRLGAEAGVYPCPIVSIRNRKPVYYEIGHTILSLLSDLRNFSYAIANVDGTEIHLQGSNIDVVIPTSSYNQMLKALNRSNEHVLAFSGGFSERAAFHLVCAQQEDGSYQSQTAGGQRDNAFAVTAASFIVISGSLKTEHNEEGRSSIVEDGVMIQVPADSMESLREKLRNQIDCSIRCSGGGAEDLESMLTLKWADRPPVYTPNVKSCIDGRSLEECRSVRFHGRNIDVSSDSRLLRLSRMYILENTEMESLSDSGDVVKQTKHIAVAACVALLPNLDLLCEAGLRKLALRYTISPETVEYTMGAQGEELPQMYMPALDTELIPILHQQASRQSHRVTVEIVLRILDL